MQQARQPARGVDGFTPPEFTSKAQLLQHYKEVKARIARSAPPPPVSVALPPPPPPPPPATRPAPLGDGLCERLPLPDVIYLPDGPVDTMDRVTVLYAVAAAAELPVRELRSHLRARALVNARFVYYVLARCYCSASLPQIGATAGGRDHTTVIHGLRMGAERFDELYPIYREACTRLCVPIPNVRRFLGYKR